MTTANELIRERVEAFVSDLNELIRQAVLEHVQAALEGPLPSSPEPQTAAGNAPAAARQGKPATSRTRSRNGAGSESLLRVLTESARPMTIRALALASTLPRDVAKDLVQQLVNDGHVTVRRGEVALASRRQSEHSDEPVEPSSTANQVHPYVVRRSGERVRRLGGS